jgi:hypothetical protein
MTNEFWIILSDVNNSIDFHHDLRAESMSYLSANILEICDKMEYKFKFRLILKKKKFFFRFQLFCFKSDQCIPLRML